MRGYRENRPGERQDNLQACMLRHKARWRFHLQAINGKLSDEDARDTRRWFEERMTYLQEQYAHAINEAGYIIGKRYHYERGVVHLHD